MNVIPLPNQYTLKSGFFQLDHFAKIAYSQELEKSAKIFQDFVTKQANIRLENSPYANISFIHDFSLESEEYRLNITSGTLTLSARSDQGAFYGVQTMLQLFKTKDGYLRIPILEIRDAPRYSYRGFMLDVARHFFPKEEIFRIIDNISAFKFNTLHLHLSDDQGFRIESSRYPKLHKIGSFREGTIKQGKLISEESANGYYTKADLKAIVAYAKTKYIEVIPEIDMPGHMIALLAAYPFAQCNIEPVKVRSDFGIFEKILCAGNEGVYTIIEELLEELFEIFDSRYFHIGGDEVPKTEWKRCPKCQAKIKEEHLKNENDLQTYFFNRIAGFLKKHNKIAIGWNDCLSKSLTGDAIIQHWKPFTRHKTIRAAKSGRFVILSDFLYLYLDYPYSMTPLKKTYNYNPNLPKANHQVLGIEAPLWTERVANSRKIDFQVFPRLLAVSEIAWTERKNKDYYHFLDRLKKLYPYLDRLGIAYATDKEKKPHILKRIIGTYRWIKDSDFEYINK